VPTGQQKPVAGLPAWIHSLAKYRSFLLPIAFIGLMIVILVPMPTWVMDVLICLNISLSVVILLTTIYMKQPLDFSVFPSLLLATTLFRLVLNVASTRLILTAKASSPEQAVGIAGEVISAFGQFVAGGSLFVGVVIFLILTIVQFVVITKGAGRISEVAARFTLDAMPGKQMAIDADLNAGMITEPEARKRREKIAQEADFFGAMDGASKFVRGDAVAGILIIAVNIIGGFGVGIIDRGWEAGKVAHVFTLLTIGDGIVSQIPSFVIAIASALIVTRSGSKDELGNEFTDQVFSQPMALFITAGFLGLLSVSPLPTIPLLTTASGLVGLGVSLRRVGRAKASSAAAEARTAAAAKPEPPAAEALLKLDALELEVGYGLVPLVDAGRGGDLLERIGSLRRQFAADMGFIVPPVRIRDNMQLPLNDYRIKIKGSVVAAGTLVSDRLMAMDSGIAAGPIDGFPTREPAFGLDAWWIDPAQRARAESLNYTVVEPSSVLATHMTEVVRQNADELLSREEVSSLVTQLKTKSPKLVEETIPGVIKLGELQKVLQNLLRERVPIRDLESVLETLGDWAGKTKDLDVLTEYVRNALRRTICMQLSTPIDPDIGAAPGRAGARPTATHRLVCVTVDPALDDTINAYIERTPMGTSVTMPAHIANQVTGAIARELQKVTAAGHQPVVICSPQVRAVVRQLISAQLPAASVLSYNEVVTGVEVESLGLAAMTPPREVAAA
jgi:flagellar biosynthesis protein FlhA